MGDKKLDVCRTDSHKLMKCGTCPFPVHSAGRESVRNGRRRKCVDGGEWRTEVREDPLPSCTLKRKGKIPDSSE